MGSAARTRGAVSDSARQWALRATVPAAKKGKTMSTADFNKDGILARVKKMMTLANNAAATEGERDNALRMAHATLMKYNLTMAEADASGAQKEEARTGEAMNVKEHPWMRTVASAIAKLFFCNFFYVASKTYNAKYYFVGKLSNVYTAQEMTKYVIASIDKEAHRVAKETTGNASGTYWRSFCKGAAYKIYQRCVEIQTTAEAAPVELLGLKTGTALVLASFYESEQKANAMFIAVQMGRRIRTGKNRQRRASADAFGRGAEFGSKISLSGTRSSGPKQIK